MTPREVQRAERAGYVVEKVEDYGPDPGGIEGAGVGDFLFFALEAILLFTIVVAIVLFIVNQVKQYKINKKILENLEKYEN